MASIKYFIGYRPQVPDTHTADQKNAPDQPQYNGIVFEDGRVVLQWLTAVRSIAIFNSYEEFEKIHGHPEYGTVIEWYHVRKDRKYEED